MDRAERAAMLHREGYNCCQAVACVFADAVGVDEALLYRIGEGFGAGMGTGRGVCGAVSGAAMIAGLVHSDGNIADPGQTKKILNQSRRQYTEEVHRAGQKTDLHRYQNRQQRSELYFVR